MLLIPTLEQNNVQITHESFVFASLRYYLNSDYVRMELTDIYGKNLHISKIPICTIPERSIIEGETTASIKCAYSNIGYKVDGYQYYVTLVVYANNKIGVDVERIYMRDLIDEYDIV